MKRWNPLAPTSLPEQRRVNKTGEKNTQSIPAAVGSWGESGSAQVALFSVYPRTTEKWAEVCSSRCIVGIAHGRAAWFALALLLCLSASSWHVHCRMNNWGLARSQGPASTARSLSLTFPWPSFPPPPFPTSLKSLCLFNWTQQLILYSSSISCHHNRHIASVSCYYFYCFH